MAVAQGSAAQEPLSQLAVTNKRTEKGAKAASGDSELASKVLIIMDCQTSLQ